MHQIGRVSALATKLSLITDLAAELSAERDLDRLGAIFSSRAKWIVEHDMLLGARLDGSEGRYRLSRVNSWRYAQDEYSSLPAHDTGLIARVFEQAIPLVCHDVGAEVAEDDPLAEYVAGMHCLLACPVFQRGKATHAVAFARKAAKPFQSEEIKIVSLLANLVTTAAANLHLFDQVERAYQVLDRELETVGQIQRDLLPRGLPEVAGYDFAVHYATSTRAGGDYYDFFALPDGRWGILIADVAGHGASAAVVMAMTRVILHLGPQLLDAPADVLSRANRTLMAHGLSGLFVTAFYGVLDPEGGEFRFAGAGHNPPLLHRAATGEVVDLSCTEGLPLAVREECGYAEQSVGIDPGDRLLLYTDGLPEAFNASGDMYGENRLESAVRHAPNHGAERFMESILADRDGFAAGHPAADDCTLIALHRRA